jgi:hypothetical protein
LVYALVIGGFVAAFAALPFKHFTDMPERQVFLIAYVASAAALFLAGPPADWR